MMPKQITKPIPKRLRPQTAARKIKLLPNYPLPGKRRSLFLFAKKKLNTAWNRGQFGCEGVKREPGFEPESRPTSNTWVRVRVEPASQPAQRDANCLTRIYRPACIVALNAALHDAGCAVTHDMLREWPGTAAPLAIEVRPAAASTPVIFRLEATGDAEL